MTSVHPFMRRFVPKVYPNSPCPLFAKTKRLTVIERNTKRKVRVVRVCQAPLDVNVDTTYLRYAAIAKKLGALSMFKAARCAFCSCGPCCARAAPGYEPRDAERAARRAHMQQFDARVREHCKLMRTMYDK